ncbi:MAG: EAL domain-containing protein [Methylococcales bacterium]|nr:EAL domain-containing protein [Methylococcales bacterium]
MSFFFKNSLKNKVSYAFLGTTLCILIILGLYFDSFLKKNYLLSSQKRMEHGFLRLVQHLDEVKNNLGRVTQHIANDEKILASISLLNQYQDKKNYNRHLLDEEKKLLLEQLLIRMKISFNNDLAIYDHNYELLVFITKQEESFHLNFFSYQQGKRQLFGKDESESTYQLENYQKNELMKYDHQAYYPLAQLEQKNFVILHLSQILIMQSNFSIFNDVSGKHLMHIELSKDIDNHYFERLSKDLGINISFSHKKPVLTGEPELEAAELLHKNIAHLDMRQTPDYFLAITKTQTPEGVVYFTSQMDKTVLSNTLRENRQQFIFVFSLVAVAMSILVRILVTRNMAKPLSDLMSQIYRIERQDYAPYEVIKTSDEIEEISKNINQLASAVRSRTHTLEYLSNHDSLTGLPNRRFFEERLTHALDLAKRDGSELAIIFFDLDGFKQINDSLGHDTGDQLLKSVANRVKTCIRNIDTVARVSGDEFIVLIEQIKDESDFKVIIDKLMNVFSKDFNCLSYKINITASIGISIYPRDGNDYVTLIKNADLAMYKVKEEGRNNYYYFTASLSEHLQERIAKIAALKQAMGDCSEFKLVYQPTVFAENNKITSIETLIRWHSSTLGLIHPEDFISLAEESGVIVQLGEWVLQQACVDFMHLEKQGYQLDHVAINVSNIQFKQGDMFAVLQKVIEQTGIKPSQIELEITESYLMGDDERVPETLIKIRSLGVKLAIDDFCTGYSSMSYLQKLPITRVKIDKAFVDGIPENKENLAISRAIIALAKTFGLVVTAEGIETKQQRDCLRAEHCNEIQGYYYSRPLDITELKKYFERWGVKKY